MAEVPDHQGKAREVLWGISVGWNVGGELFCQLSIHRSDRIPFGGAGEKGTGPHNLVKRIYVHVMLTPYWVTNGNRLNRRTRFEAVG